MGFAMVAGGNPGMKVPTTGIQAGTLAVGSVVKLMEGGTAVEYLVVNQGKPSGSSLYDDSCDGTWLLRKDVHSERQWNSSNVNDYANSTINTWLNGDFFNSLGSVEQAAAKQVKIPYRAGSSSNTNVTSGASGLSCKIFYLSATEVAFNRSNMPVNEGAVLSYFDGSAASDSDAKRVAYLNGSTASWWGLRSPYCHASYLGVMLYVNNSGGSNGISASNSMGVRPALVIPQAALFDASTLILKGAA